MAKYIIFDALRDSVPFAKTKKCENTHRGVFLSVKLLQTLLLKVTLLRGCFLRFHFFKIVQTVTNRAKRLIYCLIYWA